MKEQGGDHNIPASTEWKKGVWKGLVSDKSRRSYTNFGNTSTSCGQREGGAVDQWRGSFPRRDREKKNMKKFGFQEAPNQSN
ncbi:hypothetical protein Bca4012_058704 [Brassica carinata]|uniref:Uncharacterized protein n=1 Tax=Brassica carinata TaxID=52824 RepID=A0A8X8B5D3_BRACI|nr:hypothetical protein Bca52824_016413 [Brassica carinata]